jgi:hypothetical protein
MHLCAAPDAGSGSNLPRNGSENLQEARDPAFGPPLASPGFAEHWQRISAGSRLRSLNRSDGKPPRRPGQARHEAEMQYLTR